MFGVHQNHLEDFLQIQVARPHRQSLIQQTWSEAWGCKSVKFLGDADAVGPRTTLREPLLPSHILSGLGMK